MFPRNFYLMFEEVTLKTRGRKWRVDKNDADKLPSDPHAHNLETNEKLDLSNGRLYRGGRDTGDWLRKSELIELRKDFEARGMEMPPLTV